MKNVVKSRFAAWERLLDQQQSHCAAVVDVDDAHAGEVAFLFFGLFGQDVALVGVFTLDLSGSGEGESFLCTGVCFHFRHFS